MRPPTPGVSYEVRIVGVIAAEQSERGRKVQNDRLLGVAIHSYQHEAIRSVADVGRTVLSQIEDFFIWYNRQRGKTFKVKSTSGPRRALQLLQAGTRAYEQHPSADPGSRVDRPAQTRQTLLL